MAYRSSYWWRQRPDQACIGFLFSGEYHEGNGEDVGWGEGEDASEVQAHTANMVKSGICDPKTTDPHCDLINILFETHFLQRRLVHRACFCVLGQHPQLRQTVATTWVWGREHVTE